jgi:hypothetical protein
MLNIFFNITEFQLPFSGLCDELFLDNIINKKPLSSTIINNNDANLKKNINSENTEKFEDSIKSISPGNCFNFDDLSLFYYFNSKVN